MNILIVGASGLVGSHLVMACQQRGWNVVGTYHQFEQPHLKPLKITDADAVQALIQETQPQVVFLPAFRSNVDYCEQNPEETYQINVVGSLNVAKSCKEVDAKLVFYSSDYVFNGEAGPYREVDEPEPICVYGRQKLEVEQQISQLMTNYLILRVTVVYGHEAQGKNFLIRLISTLQNGQMIRVPEDQVGSPTLVDDIAEASCRLIEAGVTGLFHVAGPDVMSRYEFSLTVAELLGLERDNILPVITSELEQLAKRPLKAGMVCDRLVETINWKLKGVVDALNHLKNSESLG